MLSLDYPSSVRWQQFLAPHTGNIQKPTTSPECLLGEVTQPSGSPLSETTLLHSVISPTLSAFSHAMIMTAHDAPDVIATDRYAKVL